jgi:hypothetical protein
MGAGPIIGADLVETGGGLRVERLLEAFQGLHRDNPSVRLALATRRSTADYFSVANWIDAAGLGGSIGFFPYFDVCREFPVRKRDCALWIDDRTDDTMLTTPALAQALEAGQPQPRRSALFVTSFHPARPEGNSALMRQWMRYLRRAGYRVDLLYYRMDSDAVPADVLSLPGWEHDRLIEVPVQTLLVGANRMPQNADLDDWCGPELLAAADGITRTACHDVAVVNYVFLSAVFDRLPSYTHRLLLTHDRFADRNRRMATDGFARAGWYSVSPEGEARGLRRADTVIALQEAEAGAFRAAIGPGADVRVVGPIPATGPRIAPAVAPRLRIGCLGAGNRVNEMSLADLMGHWAQSPTLLSGADLILGGGLSDSIGDFVPRDVMASVNPQRVGRVAHLSDFFDLCDLAINPERGGTGIKIKSLDAMAQGVPLVATRAGAVGLGSASRFHAAEDNAALSRLLEEIVRDRTVLAAVADETTEVWSAYVRRHGDALADLLGPPLDVGDEAPARPTAKPPLAHVDRMTRAERLLFRPDGSPVPLLRFALFRRDGQPRGLMRRIVLKRNGRPRPAFREWLRHRDKPS